MGGGVITVGEGWRKKVVGWRPGGCTDGGAGDGGGGVHVVVVAGTIRVGSGGETHCVRALGR